MLGVVIWSDNTENKAVIWCEDHGELAYFDGEGASAFEGAEIDAGDLVTFEMKQEKPQRLARNMRRLQHGAYAGLSESLIAAAQPDKPDAQVPKTGGFSAASILPFARRRGGRRAAELVPA